MSKAEFKFTARPHRPASRRGAGAARVARILLVQSLRPDVCIDSAQTHQKGDFLDIKHSPPVFNGDAAEKSF
jgi:hypothetical protein